MISSGHALLLGGVMLTMAAVLIMYGACRVVGWLIGKVTK